MARDSKAIRWKSDHKKAAKVLQNEGILICGEKNRYMTKKSFKGVGVVRCYQIAIDTDSAEKTKKEIEEREILTNKILVQGELIDGVPAAEFYEEIINTMATDEIHDR